jgi:modification methylase
MVEPTASATGSPPDATTPASTATPAAGDAPVRAPTYATPPPGTGSDTAPETSVWLTGQDSDAAQRAGRYLPATLRHPGRTLPAIARRAITAYSAPGALVLDPFCGTGTTLVEAVLAGRDAIGVEHDPRWADLARANLLRATCDGSRGGGLVVRGDARDLLRLIPRRLCGEIDLIVTAAPMRLRPTTDRGRQCPAAILGGLHDDLSEVLLASSAVLRRGAHVVLTSRPIRRTGHLIDPATAIATAADRAGLRLIDRAVALRAPLRKDQLCPRGPAHRAGGVTGGHALPVIIHDDVLVYRTLSASRP